MELENEGADTVVDRGHRIHQKPTKQEIAEARLDTGDAGGEGKGPDCLRALQRINLLLPVVRRVGVVYAYPVRSVTSLP
ncbi:hypothetical protein [Micromonospora sp. NBC_01412]|uniref:hypothetical protein n=1 Tax=Micromonospora sp. NBC_01412 TaxID=2903590 RepID=UPI00324EFF61